MRSEKGKEVVTSSFGPLFKERGVDCRMHGGCRSRESTRLARKHVQIGCTLLFSVLSPELSPWIDVSRGRRSRMDSAAVVYQGANGTGLPAQANSVRLFRRASVTREMCEVVIPSQQRRRE